MCICEPHFIGTQAENSKRYIDQCFCQIRSVVPL